MGGVPGGQVVGRTAQGGLESSNWLSMCETPSPLIDVCLLGERYDNVWKKTTLWFLFQSAMKSHLWLFCVHQL